MLKVKNYFPNWIGQTEAIRYLNETLSVVAINPNFPLQPLYFESHAGLGKTKLAKTIGRVLEPMGFEFVELPSTINLPGFVQFFTQLIEGKKVVIFCDECRELIKNKKVATLLKRILETENSVESITLDSGAAITANPFQHFWIFASNEEPKDTALFGGASRTEPLKLVNYSEEEVKEIMLQKAAKHKFTIHKDALEIGCKRVMSNGRAIKTFVENDLNRYAQLGNGVISKEVMELVIKNTKRYPLGLRQIDLKTLNALALEPRGMQVGEIAMRCDGEAKETTGDRLRQLAGLGLILTGSNGRKTLAQGGIDYLGALKKMQDAAKAAKKGVETRKAHEAEKAKEASEPAKVIGTPKNSMIKTEAVPA